METKKEKVPHPFGAVLREFREKQGLTMYRVAEDSGKRISLVHQIESGRNEPKISTVFWYAEIIGVPAEEILSAMVAVLRKNSPPKKRTPKKAANKKIAAQDAVHPGEAPK